MNLTERKCESVETIEMGQYKKQSELYEGGNELSVSKISGNFLPNRIITFKERPFLMELLCEVSYKWIAGRR
jgi:hypothetical protein